MREHRRWLAYQVQRLRTKGRSQREIAKGLGISRRMVATLLGEIEQRREEGETVLEREVGPRAPKPSKLDQYEDRIREWLGKWPNLRATRCLEKLKEEGFDGGYTIVRERLRILRAELVPPKPKATPVKTAPGQRAEFDWSPYKLTEELKIQLWNVRLRWSRAPVLKACSNTKQTTILRNLRASFELWGGVPWECLTDSMPGVVDRWECDEPILNARFVDFAAHYGFGVVIAPRGCPQWKAVAENLFGYHEKNLLNARSFNRFEEYVEALDDWMESKALAGAHPETGRPVQEMLELERAELLPLPAIPYDTRDVEVRIVDDYQRVQFETNHYPVPAPVGSRVYVCADVDRIEVCDRAARRLIEHERLPDGARIKLDPPQVRRVRYDLDELTEQLAGWNEVAEEFARGVRQARRYAGPELVRLLQLRINWSVDDIVEAMRHAMLYRCHEVSKVERILEMRYTPRRFEDRLADSTRRRIQEVIGEHPLTQRPLESYDSLRHGDRASQSEPEEEDADEDSEP